MMNKITCCKLNKTHQKRLLEFFVLEVIARSAADVLQIHPNTAALFYKKVRQVITYYLQHESTEMFEGCIEMDESYFGGKRKGNRGATALEKLRQEHTRLTGAAPPPLRPPRKRRINKSITTIRLSCDVLTAFKTTGKGWQTRIDTTLQKLVTEGRI